MNRTLKTTATASMFVVLAFAFSALSVDRINYRTIVLGLEGVAGTVLTEFSRLVEESGRDTSGNKGGPEITGPGSRPEFVQLSVTVSDSSSGSPRFVRDAPVNITMVKQEEEDLLEAGEIIFGPGKGTGGQTQVAFGLTDGSGKALFVLSPGNYTVLTQHLGVSGNFSIALEPSNPRLSLRWVFRANLERPFIVQMSDENADSLLSPGENVTLFYRSASRDTPRRMIMVIGGGEDLTTDLQILSFSSLSDGIYAVVTPQRPILISALRPNSTLLIGSISYEVSVGG